MSRAISLLVALALALPLAGPAGADFEFASADLFRVRVTHPARAEAVLKPAHAAAFELIPIPGMIVGRWGFRFQGKDVHVFVGLAPAGAATSRWRIAVAAYGGLPDGWRLDTVEQRFPLRQTVTDAAADDRVHMAIVFGPTAYDATGTQDVSAVSPTFLQTQQVTITNARDRLAASLIAVDPHGHRKEMGFACAADSDERVLRVIHRPENRRTPGFFLAPAEVLFRHHIAGGAGGAIRWYRAVQTETPGSFLQQRVAAGLHPYLQPSKFTVAVGPVLTGKPVGIQYDATKAYAEAVIDGFGAIHGPGLILYHIGWVDESTSQRFRLYPDVFGRALPGCAKFVATARARGLRNVAYTLPAFVNTRSPWFDLSEVRRDIEEQPSLETSEGETFGNLCWDTFVTHEAVCRLLADVAFGRIGFDGVYLDALCAAHTCHAAHHNHAEGCNEQLAGILRWLSALETRTRKQGATPFFAGETPSEVFPIHMTGLDIAPPGARARNLFRRTYTGRELPTTHLILCYHPLLYQLELARTLTAGARPTVVWPEQDGVFPLRIDRAPDYAPFVAMLRAYCRDWDDRFRGVIDGRMLAGLPDFEATLVPPVAELAALARTWSSAVPAVFHGVFAPAPDSGERTIALVRWTTTDPAVLANLALPASHPLLAPRETVKFGLSRRVLELDDETEYEVWIERPGDPRARPLGRLPRARDAILKVSEVLESADLRIVTVRPIGI